MKPVDFHFEHEWLCWPDKDRNTGETTAELRIYLDGLCLTRNMDSLSGFTRDHVIVSLYPLAMWFASSWWRLNHEILSDGKFPGQDHDWLMNHRMTAANMGFIWPDIMFVTDSDEIHIHVHATKNGEQTPVKYLNGFDRPRTVSKEQFADRISSLVSQVIARLDAAGQKNSELAQFWVLIQEDQANPEQYQKRRIEASLGFNPDEGNDKGSISDLYAYKSLIEPQSKT